MQPKDLVTGLYTLNYESPIYKDYIIKPRPVVKKNKRENIVAVDKKSTEGGILAKKEKIKMKMEKILKKIKMKKKKMKIMKIIKMI